MSSDEVAKVGLARLQGVVILVLAITVALRTRSAAVWVHTFAGPYSLDRLMNRSLGQHDLCAFNIALGFEQRVLV